MQDFDYLSSDEIYLDAACQSLRPKCVIDRMRDYYENYNTCGGRSNYDWAKKTNAAVEATRKKVLKVLGLSGTKYAVSFTLNTSYGINLILSQINGVEYKRVITSEIEHNSVFLSSMAFAKRYSVERIVLDRAMNGEMLLSGMKILGEKIERVESFDEVIFEKAVVVCNVMANFDGRLLVNLKKLAKTVHKYGGMLILDAAQAMAHDVEILKGVEADFICFSGHKMYGPSVGVVVANKTALASLQPWFVGGGMVDDVSLNDFELSLSQHPETRLEAGLQGWAEILGLGEAIDWLEKNRRKYQKTLDKNKLKVYNRVMELPNSIILGSARYPDSSVISFCVEGMDSHLLAAALAKEKIMVRSGYFCVHYYLANKLKLPPLVRFSLGYHNNEEGIDKLCEVLHKLKA